MFEVGWSEMLVIAVVMIVIVGPKDLPKMLRTIGRMTSKMRSMAGDFQRQFNDALKEAELDDVKKSVDALKDLNPASQIRKHINPFENAANELRSGLDSLKTKPPAQVASPVTHAAEPLKNGATGSLDAAVPVPDSAAGAPAATPVASEAASPAAHVAQPLKAGAVALPDGNAPKAKSAKALKTAKVAAKPAAPKKVLAATQAPVRVKKEASPKPAKIVEKPVGEASAAETKAGKAS
ncbi:Sec-independent protein translocase protein TatB [Corticibacterium sp. UT-5YL-CI-8]|nr:Sec-independent protein translocase protein TatB [Tianweitania sp. UT-5YL-CI-8]